MLDKIIPPPPKVDNKKLYRIQILIKTNPEKDKMNKPVPSQNKGTEGQNKKLRNLVEESKNYNNSGVMHIKKLLFSPVLFILLQSTPNFSI